MSKPAETCLEPTQAAGREFMLRGIEGEVVMLNLLRFRGVADYSATPGWLIGPPDEHWDLALLVRHRSVETFIAFAADEAYGQGLGRRLAAISDSRLLPLVAGSQ